MARDIIPTGRRKRVQRSEGTRNTPTTTTIRHLAAMVKFGPAPGTQHGVIEATFYGPINDEAFKILRRGLFAAAGMTSKYVFRLDTALIMMASQPGIPQGLTRDQYPRVSAVVSGDREAYLFWLAYSADMAEAGHKFAVFTKGDDGARDHSQMAYMWAEKAAEGQ